MQFWFNAKMITLFNSMKKLPQKIQFIWLCSTAIKETYNYIYRREKELMRDKQ